MALVHESGQADEGTTGVRAPVWREESGEGGHEVGAAIVIDRFGTRLDFLGGTDHSQIVSQPLHEGAGDRDGALQRIVGFGVAELVAERGEQTVLGVDDIGARVEDQEVTGAVGILLLTLVEGRQWPLAMP